MNDYKEIADGRAMRLSILAELLDTHVDDIADEILKLKGIKNRIKAEIYTLESKRKESFYPSKKRGILYKRVKYLRSFLND
jgi:hypothetical protein